MGECRGALWSNREWYLHVSFLYCVAPKIRTFTSEPYQNHISVSIRVVSNCWMEPQVYLDVDKKNKKKTTWERKSIIYSIFYIFDDN